MSKKPVKSASKSGTKKTGPKPAGKSAPSASTGPSELPVPNEKKPYLVLARKYRPATFAALIGQDAMVQTLTNAFLMGRIAHAFMLTGVRGVGKTTTARILARALNFADENGPRPNIELKTLGTHCAAIIESRHIDVVEMDAASHTGIDDIRELNESTRYGPVSAPFKVFIIDEVHMLSKNAFNGLLKTLEEPPPYVKFIFATTEIRKVPVTILSRCQRFDLRRIVPDEMSGFLQGILEKENVGIEPDALVQIVRAGEGSVRDCLSLIDQAIAHADGEISAEAVREMLGLADRSRTIDLFEAIMGGNIAKALENMSEQYGAGADPMATLNDLAAFTHLVTRVKVVPDAKNDVALTPRERERAATLASRLGLRSLSRCWQILQKGIAEIRAANDMLQCAEMVLIRLAYAADLPTPDELIEKITTTETPEPAPRPQISSPRPPGGNSGQSARAVAPAPDQVAAPEPVRIESFTDLLALASQKRDLVVKNALETGLIPVSIRDGHLEVGLAEGANPQIIQTLSARLRDWTGRPWLVTVTTKSGAKTVRQQRDAGQSAEMEKAAKDPLVQAVLKTFPGAKLVKVRVRDEHISAANEPASGGRDKDQDTE
ncbi:MAG: DNA polymerase III subunit gamma/tau [Alphaproteobacteria bacterium]|nr:DNA polymerase III subunit gamma/tau [Alphaproteobacteria bacterium]